MTIHSPGRVWWRPVGAQERLYLGAATVFAVATFLLMPIWHFTGSQNPVMRTFRVEPSSFEARALAFIQQYKIGEESGIPVVDAPPGSDAYLIAKSWQWTPILRLQRGQTYRLHISSLDIDHGFSIVPINMNFMVIPGYEYVLEIKPTEAGTFSIICNEFCGIGHHLMIGKLIVVE